ncbi:hypothetical protein KKF84_07885 [Myxococcota bacterium]|nr:hypothetical protein [Myxococcota bacterium]MBU1535226.1 hypothetical protein [Myxococcota bacterium]
MTLFRHLILVVLLTAPSGAVAKKTRLPAPAPPLRQLGVTLVNALNQGKFSIARSLVPSRKELKALGLNLTKVEYDRFVQKRKEGFAKIHAKFAKKRLKLRKMGVTCQRFVFSRLAVGKTVKRGTKTIIKSADVFARCGKKEYWVADPDGIFRAASGWKLMEFN